MKIKRKTKSKQNEIKYFIFLIKNYSKLEKSIKKNNEKNIN